MRVNIPNLLDFHSISSWPLSYHISALTIFIYTQQLLHVKNSTLCVPNKRFEHIWTETKRNGKTRIIFHPETVMSAISYRRFCSWKSYYNKNTNITHIHHPTTSRWLLIIYIIGRYVYRLHNTNCLRRFYSRTGNVEYRPQG